MLKNKYLVLDENINATVTLVYYSSETLTLSL